MQIQSVFYDVMDYDFCEVLKKDYSYTNALCGRINAPDYSGPYDEPLPPFTFITPKTDFYDLLRLFRIPYGHLDLPSISNLIDEMWQEPFLD